MRALAANEVAALNKTVDKYNLANPSAAVSPAFRFDVEKEAAKMVEEGEGNRDFFGGYYLKCRSE